MSNSWNTEQELRKLAEELHNEAYQLEVAADTLATLRDADYYKKQIKEAKERAKSWV